jgi:hypothetical protein
VAKAFVDGWLHSGPWVQLLTALAVWKKLGTPGGLGGKGGGGGGSAALGGKATPTPVWVVNWGKVPGGGSLPGGKTRTRRPAGAKTAKTVGRFAGPVGAAITAGELVHALFPSFGEKNARPARAAPHPGGSRSGRSPRPGSAAARPAR